MITIERTEQGYSVEAPNFYAACSTWQGVLDVLSKEENFLKDLILTF